MAKSLISEGVAIKRPEAMIRIIPLIVAKFGKTKPPTPSKGKNIAKNPNAVLPTPKAKIKKILLKYSFKPLKLTKAMARLKPLKIPTKILTKEMPLNLGLLMSKIPINPIIVANILIRLKRSFKKIAPSITA